MDRIFRNILSQTILFILIMFSFAPAKNNNKNFHFPAIPLQSVKIKLTLYAEGMDLISKEVIKSRQDTSMFLTDNYSFSCKIIDRNVVFWDNLLANSKMEIIPDDYLKGLCGCKCNEASITIIDSLNNEITIDYQECGKTDLIGKMGKIEFLIQLNDEEWVRFENHMKKAFKKAIERFKDE